MRKIVAVLAALGGFFIAQTSWSTCSNYTSYTSGQTLTASSLNSLQTNYTDCVNNVLNGDTFTGAIALHSGSDLNVFSDAGSTLKAAIDGATGAAVLGLTQEGQMTNCGVTVSGSTITIAGYDGTALSATNPCVVAIRSSTAGNLSLAYFTANISTTFGATSDTDGNNFGLTGAVNWENTLPMFLGVVNGSSVPFWTISRLPFTQTGAAATALCQEGDVDCDAQLDMLAMTTGLTLASEVDKPVTQVGWFDATYATTGGAWTFAATGKNGFNKNYTGVQFTMPLAQNGAATGTFFLASGGTAPLFTTNRYVYSIGSNGVVTALIDLEDDPGTDGAGAVTSLIALPLSPVSTAGSYHGDGFTVSSIGGAASVQNVLAQFSSSGYGAAFGLVETGGTNIQNGDFSNGGRYVIGKLSYPTLP